MEQIPQELVQEADNQQIGNNFKDDIKQVDKANGETLDKLTKAYFEEGDNQVKLSTDKGIRLGMKIYLNKNSSKENKKTIQKYFQSIDRDDTFATLNSNQESIAKKSKDASQLSDLLNYGKTPEIRQIAMFNPNIGDETLENFVAKHPDAAKNGLSMHAKNLLFASSQAKVKNRDNKLKAMLNLYDGNPGPNNFFKHNIELRIAKNDRTPVQIMKTLTNSNNESVKNAALKTMKGFEDESPFQQDDEENATEYSATLSLNKMVGRLHDVAIEAIQSRHKGWFDKLLSNVAAGAGIENTGIIDAKNGGNSIFKGVSNSQIYKIIVTPGRGLFGKKKAIVEAMTLYLKYFAGIEIDINVDDIKSTDIEKISNMSIAKKDTRGKKIVSYVYPYRINFKVYNNGKVSDSANITESGSLTNFEGGKNMWISENINPYNHNEQIVESDNGENLESFIKAVQTGQNVEAKKLLENKLKQMIQKKIKTTLK